MLAALARGTRTTTSLTTGKRFISTIVVGSIALDTHWELKKSLLKYGDSNPASIAATAVGGVGYNVAEASRLQGNNDLKFVSVVGDDLYGNSIGTMLKFPSSIDILANEQTSQYTSVQDSEGNGLILGLAAMGIIEKLNPDFVESEIRLIRPKLVLTDANVSEDMIHNLCRWSLKYGFKLVFEPTSFKKASKLSAIVGVENATGRPVVLASTPTINELETIYDKFQGLAGALSGDLKTAASEIARQIESQLHKAPNAFLAKLINEHVLQKGIQLSSYVENWIIKDGGNGVVIVAKKLTKECQVDKLANFGFIYELNSTECILIEHYNVANLISKPKNVNGAGDAFAGSLLKDLTVDSDALNTSSRGQVVMKAQDSSYRRLLKNMEE